MKTALYWEKEKDSIRCQLCPHLCLIADGKAGRCRERKNVDGTLYAMNYGVITSVGLDPIEKKPLYHFMPGSTVLSYGSRGCNLSCSFCQNYRISMEPNPPHIIMPPDEAIQKVKDENLSSIAFTYNEPTVWYEFVLETARLAKEHQIRTVCVTNGFINKEPLEELLGCMDAFNIDLKSYSDAFYRKICGGRLGPVLNAIKLIHGKAHIEITTLVVENENDDLEELEELFKWIASIDTGIALHLSRYFPSYKMTNPATKIETLIEAKRLAEKHLDNVYIGNVPGIR
ncbi:MAG: AmmeMemoRadiSam system radical SAM enzyme [Eubacteriales bacterium]|nr:AmmeMemoRadiSam system radical SAM enzyme [Eubacteriales bacterium]